MSGCSFDKMIGMSHKDYGFIPEDAINKKFLLRRQIYTGSREWSTTYDFREQARNHCGATMLTNFIQLENYRQGQSTASHHQPAAKHSVSAPAATAWNRQEAMSIFPLVHRYVRNGPVLFLRGKAKRYFAASHMSYLAKPIRRLSADDGSSRAKSERKFRRIAASLREGHPVALLVAASLLNWHWVLAVGYTIYTDGSFGLRIVDEWHRKGLRIYVPDEGSRLLSALSLERI